MGLDGHRHKRNTNVLVIGGSGAGKSRSYAIPNVLQCGCSMIVTDPKSEILRKTGSALQANGYEVRVFDLLSPDTSFCYNPLAYVRDDKDVLRLIETLIQSTTPPGSQSADPFWQKSETALLQALVLYLIHEAPEDEQNFAMVMEMPIGMLVTLDTIFNRVIQNWKQGKTTWVFADEFYLLFRYQYSADFFYKLWKRIRKYNGLVTGLTQNVDEILRSDTARLMLANSEFLILLNQSATDREELARLLHISGTQMEYITNVAAGCGLIRCAGNIVPFENSFPRDTRLYQLMTTKPDEALRKQ